MLGHSISLDWAGDPTWAEQRHVTPRRRVAWRQGPLQGTGELATWGRMHGDREWWGQVRHDGEQEWVWRWHPARDLRPLD